MSASEWTRLTGNLSHCLPAASPICEPPPGSSPIARWFAMNRARQKSLPTRKRKPYGWACPQSLLAKYGIRSEEHTSELQSLMRISYAVFCLKKKKKKYKNKPILTNEKHI